MSKLLLAILALVSVAVIGVGSVLLYTKLTNNGTPQVWPILTDKNTSQISSVPTTIVSSTSPLFSGTVTKIEYGDLGLIAFTQTDIDAGVQVPAYYSAGVYLYGKYKGFTRVVSVEQPMGPGGSIVRIFATKDFKTYILDGDKYSADNFDTDSYYNPLSGLERAKISKVENIDSEHPSKIDLDSNFALFKSGIATTSITIPTDNNYASANNNPADMLLTDLADYKISTLSKPNLTFYTAKNNNTQGQYNNYVDGDTSFLVKDETGIVYRYELALKSQISSYIINKQKYLESMVAYEKAEKTEPGVYHSYPEYVSTPTVSFNSSDIVSTEKLYEKYSVAFPQACGTDTATKVLKSVTDSDLALIGKIGSINIYKLKNSNHPLLKQEFETKVNYDKAFFKNVNNIDPPVYTDYVARNPLLVFKDPLERFVAVGEFDYLLSGGCGKPVVYLYPEVPTVVSVKLVTPIEFTQTIPTYDGGKGWEVLANPNGKLQNLSLIPENCFGFKPEFGNEYAKSSCLSNSYPYLYWSGTSVAKPYPKMDKGWVVSKEDLNNFLNEKLSYMGLNQKEIDDFTNYWLYMMQKKDSPYYRVSFLQNKELNALIPMNVSPLPKTSIRVFMDWEPLENIIDIAPQDLVQTSRSGFTLVEWGGLKF